MNILGPDFVTFLKILRNMYYTKEILRRQRKNFCSYIFTLETRLGGTLCSINSSVETIAVAE